ncbi:Uridine kinase family protein [Rhodovulum sp. P5]|uniref:nucleoside/nucleotide kinase family protein n=1 Tax=Rhodovulum sp. P5 TaxID=1564506 RepID=UPI0009C21A72|nr:nucleoside/nucleotide kinase family protein [Rhodovulum sp. P5]ARE40814.1 Uridine kinase family protein [Rhodovulum sp. P5]
MSEEIDTVTALADRIGRCPVTRHRRVVAVAGAPGSGKSRLARALSEAVTQTGTACVVVPMDGFHLDNRLLDARGLRARKGAPDTFDVMGFQRLVAALHDDEEVIFPLFDRARDIAIAGAGRVARDCDTVIVEGNYLLFDAPHWRDLAAEWDLSVFRDVPEAELLDRLTRRWLKHGLPPDAARARAETNDMANARAVAGQRLPADILFRGDAPPAPNKADPA